MDRIAQYHLPGLFEFYELYRVFLPLYCTHRDWFYPWCDIASLYGAPADCMWGGGRVGGGDVRPRDALALAQEYAEHPFHVYTVEEYIDVIVKYIRLLRKDLVLERFVSQSPKELLIAPKWGLKNYEFTNLLNNRLKSLQ